MFRATIFGEESATKARPSPSASPTARSRRGTPITTNTAAAAFIIQGRRFTKAPY